MELSGATPRVFVSLDENEAYAGTSYSEWQQIVKQMENFKSLKVKEIEHDARECDICLEPFGRSNNNRPSEEPIQLRSCGHVFGHVCLFNWLVKLMPDGKWFAWDANWPQLSEEAFQLHEEDEFRMAIRHTNVDDVSIAFHGDDQLIKRDWRELLNWISDEVRDLVPTSGPQIEVRDVSCPKCRATFSIHRSGLTGVKIEARLHFWDRLYEKLGLARSAKEEQSRSDLLRYVQMVQVPRIDDKLERMRSFTLQAQASAMRFALRRGNRDLDPQQTYIRDAIFNLGCYGLHEGEYSATSYENRRVPLWCYQVDRIERGLSPIVSVSDMDETTDGETEEDEPDVSYYSRKVCRELKQQVSGPWRRNLFTEVGGDRDGLRWETGHGLRGLAFRIEQLFSD